MSRSEPLSAVGEAAGGLMAGTAGSGCQGHQPGPSSEVVRRGLDSRLGQPRGGARPGRAPGPPARPHSLRAAVLVSPGERGGAAGTAMNNRAATQPHPNRLPSALGWLCPPPLCQPKIPVLASRSWYTWDRLSTGPSPWSTGAPGLSPGLGVRGASSSSQDQTALRHRPQARGGGLETGHVCAQLSRRWLRDLEQATQPLCLSFLLC